MADRLQNIWELIKAGLWFIPGLMALLAIALAVVTLTLDRKLSIHAAYGAWLWGGGPEGAREVLSTIAGSMITVAGVAFSVTMVALSVAAAQFGSLLLRSFMRDAGNQIVLGTFIGTFVYCLLVLGAVRSGGTEYVPHLSVNVGILLAIISLGVFIFFIHHLSRSLQAEDLAATLGAQLTAAIHHIFPEQLGEGGPRPRPRDPAHPPPERRGELVFARQTGYLQAIANEELLARAAAHELIVHLLVRPGDFVGVASPIVEVWPSAQWNDRIAGELATTLIIGRQRTPTQDVEYAAHQLVEIAVRALSPGINDPFAAMTCIDWLGVALGEVAGRDIPSIYRYDGRGELRVIASTTDFPSVADISLNQIRQYGRESVPVLLRMVETIMAVGRRVRREEDAAALREHLRRLAEEAAGLPNGRDRSKVERLLADAMRELDTQSSAQGAGADSGEESERA